MVRVKSFMLFLILQGNLLTAFSQDITVVPDDRLVINDILIEGNRVTRPSIIIRELPFSRGDTILKMELLPALQRSRENLLNLAIFNFVYFDATHLPGNRIDVHITVTERWYIWPVPLLEYAERNFSEFIKNREWDKINYGLYLKWNNFRGRKEMITGKLRLGYVKDYALAYDVPNIGKRQQHGLSTGFNLKQQNEVYIATVNNMPVEFKLRGQPAEVRFNTYIRYNFRRKLYTTHTLRLEYSDYRVPDTVAVLNSNFMGEGRSRLNFFTASYNFNHDMRDSKIYPLEGFAVNIRAEQLGIGLIKDFPYPSFRLTANLMFHQKLANRIYFYNTTKVRYSTEKYMPYALNKALGYNEFMSAYEAYVIDGSDYVISKYNLKFQLIKPTTRTLPLIRMEQFNKIHYALYLNLFADAGYVNNDFPDPTNTMVNNWQFSTGVGLDIVTYYDQVLRIDFAMNRYREHGIFFHIETPFFRW